MSAKKKKPSGPFESLRALKEDMEKREKEAKAKPPSAANAPKAPPASPRRPATSPGPEGPEDEAMLFHRLFAGVEPLDRSRGGRLPRQGIELSPGAAKLPKAASEAARADAESVHAHLRSLVEGGSRFEVEDDGVRISGRRVDLPLDALRRLRRGLLPIDARLDLHGLTVPQARAQLEAFLRTTRARGEIGAWLSQSAAAEHVAAFATASAVDGGEGAVYVLLRR
jgi:DNA-nicking Smr family endonuclease